MARRRQPNLPAQRDLPGVAQPSGQTRVEQRVVSVTWSAPLPPAEELERYAAIMPDLPSRLVANWENQTNHRIDLEKRVIQGDVRRANWGLILGWIFAMALLAGSVFLISTGHEGIGVTTLLIELAALGGTLVFSDFRRRQERNSKAGR